MLQIKLSRIGKKKMPAYRLVILEKGRDPYGKVLEILGNYNPRAKQGNFKTERIKYWISKGAQTTDTVANLFIANKIIEGARKKSYKINKKKRAKLEDKQKSAKNTETKGAETASMPEKAEVKTETAAEQTK